MTIYEKNLKTLAKHYEKMDVLIEDARRKNEETLEIMEELSYEGEPILKIKKDDRICYLNGKRNTTEPAKMWAKHLGKLMPNAPVFLMGLGNPTYLKELVDKAENPVTIIVYEPSFQIFLRILQMVDLERWMEKHLIVFWVKGIEGMDWERLKGLLTSLLRYEVLNLSRHLVLPNYDVLFPEETLEFVQGCRDIVKDELVQRNTKMRFSSLVAKNLLANARYVADGYKTTQLVNIVPEGVPGIVVAAGPSLNKNIKDLKAAKGKAFIIAVDTAVKPLLREGIVPDMFAIVDAKKPVELVQIEGAEQIPLLPSVVAASDVMDFHTGMKFFANEGYQVIDEMLLHHKMEYADVPTGGSVATSAFALLYKLGIETIILVGQDLAFTNNRSHADRTFAEKMEEMDTSGCIMVEGNNEEKVPSREDLQVYIEWYGMFIEGCQKENPNFRVINATEGGAKIKNTEITTLKDAIARECKIEVDIPAFLSGLKPMFAEDRDWAVKYLKGIPDKCTTLMKDAGNAKKLYQKLDKLCRHRNIDQKEYTNLLKKLEKQIQKIETQSMYDLAAITMSEAQYILKNERFLEYGSIQEEGKEIARKGILYMEKVIECVSLFREYAESVYADFE
ncbi:MAG: motility associated factor glycosyltransferase family protein [Roseburia sp.]